MKHTIIQKQFSAKTSAHPTADTAECHSSQQDDDDEDERDLQQKVEERICQLH